MEDTRTIHCGHYTVRTSITANPAFVCEWIDDIRQQFSELLSRGRLLVGLGVQWVPAGTTIAAATIQLCTGYRCLIFQLLHTDRFPDALRRFLVDHDVMLVGLWNDKDPDILGVSRHRVRIDRLLDVGYVAWELGMCCSYSSMGTLAANILGLRGVEDQWVGVGRSNWANSVLTRRQVIYACHDAFISFLLARELRIYQVARPW